MFALSLLLLKAFLFFAALQAAGLPGDPVQSLVAAAGALAATAILGGLKKYPAIADSWVAQKIRPIQPLLVLGLSVALPALIHGTPNVPDPQALVTAPTATLLAVAAAELLRRWKPAPSPWR